jgi:primosomal protein N' (replication factor Y)
MAGGKSGILVGTQMLAKGHHFPKVTLVAILDADTGLFSPDFRGQEQMLQLLLQVAGRAGRAEQAGKVLIQTRHPTHPMLQTLLQQDYQAQAGLLLEDRKSAAMPPYGYLALFRAEASVAELPAKLLSEIRSLCVEQLSIKPLPSVSLLGPIPAPMERKAGRYRMQLRLQSNDRTALQRLLTSVVPRIEQCKLTRKVRWSVDVDPLDMI